MCRRFNSAKKSAMGARSNSENNSMDPERAEYGAKNGRSRAAPLPQSGARPPRRGQFARGEETHEYYAGLNTAYFDGAKAGFLKAPHVRAAMKSATYLAASAGASIRIS